MEILEKEIDAAGKWRVLVLVSNERSLMFKYQDEPDDAVVLADCEALLLAETQHEPEPEA